MNSDILGCIFMKIDDSQTVLKFASCSKLFLNVARKFSELKQIQLTQITTNQLTPFPHTTYITTDFPSGWSETRNQLGELFSCGRKRNGLMHGIWKMWDVYGNLIDESEYINGVKQGKSKVWDTTDDGQQGISMTCRFRNGQPHGLQKGWWFPRYFAWYINGKHEWLLIGLVKSCLFYVRDKLRVFF